MNVQFQDFHRNGIMSGTKAFDSTAASGAGYKGAFADPLALATKPAVIFKFASSVSIVDDFFEQRQSNN